MNPIEQFKSDIAKLPRFRPAVYNEEDDADMIEDPRGEYLHQADIEWAIKMLETELSGMKQEKQIKKEEYL